MRLVLKREIGTAGAGQRVDSYLRQKLGLSRKAVRTLKTCRGIHINGQDTEARRVLDQGDELSLWLPFAQSHGVYPEPIQLVIAYEDEHMLVADKPAGMVTHPVKSHQSGTLANGVAHFFLEKGEPSRSHPVNRLDKDTSGLVAFAKHPLAHDQLVQQMEQRVFQRCYMALVYGNLEQEHGSIDLPITESRERPERWVAPEGKSSRTLYRVVERFGRRGTLVQVTLESGRTHQIRVHFAAVGHPLIGEQLYSACENTCAVERGGGVSDIADRDGVGGRSAEHGGADRGRIGSHKAERGGIDGFNLKRQALHACSLEFLKPFTQQKMVIKSPLPEDLEEAIIRLRNA